MCFYSDVFYIIIGKFICKIDDLLKNDALIFYLNDELEVTNEHDSRYLIPYKYYFYGTM